MEALMGEKELFEGLPPMAAPKEEQVSGRPRMREPERRQVEWRSVDLDSLLAVDHPARVIWRYVEQLDLRVLEEKIRAREHTLQRPVVLEITAIADVHELRLPARRRDEVEVHVVRVKPQ